MQVGDIVGSTRDGFAVGRILRIKKDYGDPVEVRAYNFNTGEIHREHWFASDISTLEEFVYQFNEHYKQDTEEEQFELRQELNDAITKISPQNKLQEVVKEFPYTVKDKVGFREENSFDIYVGKIILIDASRDIPFVTLDAINLTSGETKQITVPIIPHNFISVKEACKLARAYVTAHMYFLNKQQKQLDQEFEIQKDIMFVLNEIEERNF